MLHRKPFTLVSSRTPGMYVPAPRADSMAIIMEDIRPYVPGSRCDEIREDMDAYHASIDEDGKFIKQAFPVVEKGPKMDTEATLPGVKCAPPVLLTSDYNVVMVAIFTGVLYGRELSPFTALYLIHTRFFEKEVSWDDEDEKLNMVGLIMACRNKYLGRMAFIGGPGCYMDICALSGEVDTMKYLHEHGATWPKYVRIVTITSPGIVKYADENGATPGVFIVRPAPAPTCMIV